MDNFKKMEAFKNYTIGPKAICYKNGNEPKTPPLAHMSTYVHSTCEPKSIKRSDQIRKENMVLHNITFLKTVLFITLATTGIRTLKNSCGVLF